MTNFIDKLLSYPPEILFFIIIAAFIAGFIDAIVGGGGLIQFPAFMIAFPQSTIPTAFGTNKISGFSGTTVAAIKYGKQVKFNYKLLLLIAIFAFISANIGTQLVTLVNKKFLNPCIFILLVVIAIYTFVKKDFGQYATKNLALHKQYAIGIVIGIVVGFYDGFFGPGTGSFLMLGFVGFLGFPFLQASAYAKVINCITNISYLIIFIKNQNYILEIALLMAFFNIFGSIIGTRLAILKGNSFIRKIFLLVIVLLLVRFGMNIFV
jgi:uncharacterized protein